MLCQIKIKVEGITVKWSNNDKIMVRGAYNYYCITMYRVPHL